MKMMNHYSEAIDGNAAEVLLDFEPIDFTPAFKIFSEIGEKKPPRNIQKQ